MRLVFAGISAIKAVSSRRRRATSLEENTASMNRRLDNMDRRIERIESWSKAYASKSAWNEFPEAY